MEERKRDVGEVVRLEECEERETDGSHFMGPPRETDEVQVSSGRWMRSRG